MKIMFDGIGMDDGMIGMEFTIMNLYELIPPAR